MAKKLVENEEAVVEETPIKVKKGKKEKTPKKPNLYTVVDRLIKQANLPVYEEGQSPREFVTVEAERPLPKKKKTSSKKQMLEEQQEKVIKIIKAVFNVY